MSSFVKEKQELQIANLNKEIEKLRIENQVQRGQIDKLKITLIQYDNHIRDTALVESEMMIEQLEVENSHLRKLLNIPNDLFLVDPEEEKKKEA